MIIKVDTVEETEMIKNDEQAKELESEYLGCQSHSCYLEKPKGMGTNGPCRCLYGLSKSQQMKVKRILKRLRNELSAQ